ncbi:MAG: 50S ribosomal protein L4 [Candidatus Doudnabacteria bacterium]|nr:50S ribosomal protein L4 [Candidatus Doudnabacteria bacterium]
MKVKLYNQKAEVVGDIDLNSKIYEVKPNTHLLAEAVRIQLSNSRKGLANTKTRGEVSGGGKKPWKQKGTGRARAGSIRSPLWRHGGVTFGPRSNRNWTLKLNKKAAKQALFMALSDKVVGNKFIVVDSIVLEHAKTKEVSKIINLFKKNLEIGKKQLLLTAKEDKNLIRASRNLNGISPLPAHTVNLHEVLKADCVIVPKSALEVIEKTFLKN